MDAVGLTTLWPKRAAIDRVSLVLIVVAIILILVLVLVPFVPFVPFVLFIILVTLVILVTSALDLCLAIAVACQSKISMSSPRGSEAARQRGSEGARRLDASIDWRAGYRLQGRSIKRKASRFCPLKE